MSQQVQPPAASRDLVLVGSIILIIVGSLGSIHAATMIISTANVSTGLAVGVASVAFLVIGAVGFKTRVRRTETNAAKDKVVKRFVFGSCLFLLISAILSVLAVAALISYVLVVCSGPRSH